MAWTSRLAEYVAELRSLGRPRFLAAYPHPVLVHHFGRDADGAVERRGAAAGAAKFRTELPPGGGAANGAALAGDRTDLEAAVHPLKKRPGNAYPDTITVGRADSNDVVVPYDDLSKLHAYFTRSPGGALLVADAGSTNGTWVDGERLAANASRVLGERARLTLGDHELELLGPAALADLVASLAAAS